MDNMRIGLYDSMKKSDEIKSVDNIISHSMLGMELDYLTVEQYLAQFANAAAAGESGYCCVTNVHECILTYDDAGFRKLVNAATFVITDSTILQRARTWRHRVPLIDIIRGAEIMLKLCEAATLRGIKIALIGGKDDVVLGLLQSKLLRLFPGLQIAFAYSPLFRLPTDAEDAVLISDIQESGAQIIFVGLGCPKQERWMAAHTTKLDAMMIGVGAAFDFNAGIVKPSPAWVHKFGLEWLYRLLSEPKRLWKRYLSTSPRFVWLLMLDWFRGQSDELSES